MEVPPGADGDEVDNRHYKKRGNEAYEYERDVLIGVKVVRLGLRDEGSSIPEHAHGRRSLFPMQGVYKIY